jgi:hypothetical protein
MKTLFQNHGISISIWQIEKIVYTKLTIVTTLARERANKKEESNFSEMDSPSISN